MDMRSVVIGCQGVFAKMVCKALVALMILPLVAVSGLSASTSPKADLSRRLGPFFSLASLMQLDTADLAKKLFSSSSNGEAEIAWRALVLKKAHLPTVLAHNPKHDVSLDALLVFGVLAHPLFSWLVQTLPYFQRNKRLLNLVFLILLPCVVWHSFLHGWTPDRWQTLKTVAFGLFPRLAQEEILEIQGRAAMVLAFVSGSFCRISEVVVEHWLHFFIIGVLLLICRFVLFLQQRWQMSFKQSLYCFLGIIQVTCILVVVVNNWSLCCRIAISGFCVMCWCYSMVAVVAALWYKMLCFYYWAASWFIHVGLNLIRISLVVNLGIVFLDYTWNVFWFKVLDLCTVSCVMSCIELDG